MDFNIRGILGIAPLWIPRAHLYVLTLLSQHHFFLGGGVSPGVIKINERVKESKIIYIKENPVHVDSELYPIMVINAYSQIRMDSIGASSY